MFLRKNSAEIVQLLIAFNRRGAEGVLRAPDRRPPGMLVEHAVPSIPGGRGRPRPVLSAGAKRRGVAAARLRRS